jgi:hypothetical protein
MKTTISPLWIIPEGADYIAGQFVWPCVEGCDVDGIKQVLGIWIQPTEGAKFWHGVLTQLRNQGCRDALFVCCGGLTGLPESISAGLAGDGRSDLCGASVAGLHAICVPNLTAGTALVGAGAIALSPINPVATKVHDLHVPAVMSEAVALAAGTNPIQTVVATFANLYTAVNGLGASMAELPAPLARQSTANLINYAGIDIGGYPAAAFGAASYYGGTGPGTFQATINTAIADLQAGNISAATSFLYGAFIGSPVLQILMPMEAALVIPVDIAANLANAVSYAMVTTSSLLGVVVTGTLGAVAGQVGNDLQAAYNSAVSGDVMGTITSLVDIPLATVNALLTGATFTNNGLVGLAQLLLVQTPQQLASVIVSPGAQNIAAGGSLGTALHNFITQVRTGWPSLSELASIPAGFAAGLMDLPQAIFGAIATTVHGLIGGAAATAAVAGSADTRAPAAAASPVALTVNLSVPRSLNASAEGTASSATTAANDPSDQATVTGASAPHLRVHRYSTAGDSSATDITIGTSGDSSNAVQGPTQSLGKHHSSSGSARHGNAASSGSGSGK